MKAINHSIIEQGLENLNLKLNSVALDDLAVEFLEDHPLCAGLLNNRIFERFDFTNEWNNLGYGRISVDGSSFAIAPQDFADDRICLAWVTDHSNHKICPYISLVEDEKSAELFIHRPHGCVDGFDQMIVDRFLTDYRWQELGSCPWVSEIPAGFDAAVTMRIDCDEAIHSGQALADLYAKNNFPFSMAIKTEQMISENDLETMRSVLKNGGSIVTHSHTHAPNWGGSAKSAIWEVQESHRVLRSLGIDGIDYRYAVSPFHQNPPHVVEGLKKSGLQGFVGGIIHNDPEMLFFGAKTLDQQSGFFMHTQQSMMHGQTYEEQGHKLDVFFESFRLHTLGHRMYAFLDHPFSSYWYGWKSEEQRLQAHQDLLNHINSKGKVWKASLVDAMDFLKAKLELQASLDKDPSDPKISTESIQFLQSKGLSLQYRYLGKWHSFNGLV